MSSESKEKVKNILTELSIEMTGTRSIPKLAKELGYSKQYLYQWIEDEKIPLESVKSKIENINPRFLTGESKLIYKTGKPGNGITTHPVYELLKEERSRYGIEDIPDTETGRALQDVLDDAVSLVLKLRRLIEMEKRNEK